MDSNQKAGEGLCFKKGDFPRLSIVMDARDLIRFFRFLQHGFFVITKTGESVKDMLCERFGLDPDYAVNRIKTVFLNGKPVDDMEKAVIRDGCTLALSAAMPGLVGATFRSGGVLSPFRAAISYRPEECAEADSGEGAVYLKLFNLLVPEMGPAFLERGIFVEKSLLDEFLMDGGPEFLGRCRSILLDEKPVGAEELIKSGVASSKEFVFLKAVKP